MNKDDFSVDEILKEIQNPEEEEFMPDEMLFEDEAPPPEKKKKWSLFGKKKEKRPDFNEQEDAYYGVQIKPLSELRKGFDATGEIATEDNTYLTLFDDTELDEEVERNFQRIQRERRRRVAAAVESAGVNVDDVANELGIVAPMPVTSFAADPYAKQHGIAAEDEGETGFQKAMMHTAEQQTMEIKLNVLNDTVELQKNLSLPAVDSETVSRILTSAETQDASPAAPTAAPTPPLMEDIQSNSALTDVTGTVPPLSQNTSLYLDIPSEPMAEFPKPDELEKYRNKTVPVHIVNIDVLQSAILSESSAYAQKAEAPKTTPFNRFVSRLLQEEKEDSVESIDDYTSPADAKSVAHELKGNMRSLSLRLLITGLSTLVLFFTTAIFESSFSNGDPANNPAVYLIITLILVLACAGFCYKSIWSGLKNLIRFQPNADSAAAVATVAVLLQTVFGFVNFTPLATGQAHLYGLLVSLALFLNALGKLTMLRRIHSNFRFVTAREQKFAVKLYGDYNTSLKMAKDCVAETPVIAYQQKATFLKRFLQLSYDPDPSETTSQNLAPLALVLSLLLCLICLFVTRDLYLSVTAFAAACCVSVAVTNMLAVNLPISKLCKRARRAGSMLVGWDAVDQMSNANAVMLDAGELFPAGTVVLEGVKTFGSGNPEKTILHASALIHTIGGTLSDVFEQVIQENEEALPAVTQVQLEDEHGVCGVVDGKSILVGNRTLLLNHQIEPPERDEVTKFTAGGKKVLFIAIDGRVEAMLILTYKADRRKRIELQRLEENGVSLIVRSSDANITPTLIGKLFEISPSSVNVLTGELAETYDKLVAEEIPRADALVATKGRAESMMHLVSACVSEKKTISLLVALQNIAAVLGFVLVAFMCCFSGFAQLTAMAIFIYEIFWLAILLLLPRLKRP